MTYHSYEGVVRLLADRISQWLQRFAHVVGGGRISSRAIMPRVFVIKSGYCGRIRRLLRKVRRFASESAGQTRDGFARGPRRLVIVLHTTLSNGSAHFSVMGHRGI